MIKITLLETNRVHIQIDEKTVQVGTDRIGYTVVQGTSTAKVQVDYGETYKSWNKSVIMTNAQGRSIRKPLEGMYSTFTFDLPIEMTIAPYTKLLFQAVKGDQVQRWTIVDIPIARTAEGQMPPIPSTDAEEIRQLAQDAKNIADQALEEAARSGTSVLVGGVPQTSWDADTKLDKTEHLNFNQLLSSKIFKTFSLRGLNFTQTKKGFSIQGTNTDLFSGVGLTQGKIILNKNHFYYLDFMFSEKDSSTVFVVATLEKPDGSNDYTKNSTNKYVFTDRTIVKDIYINVKKLNTTINATCTPILVDLTEMFGAGNEPTSVAEANKYIQGYYPYTDKINRDEFEIKIRQLEDARIFGVDNVGGSSPTLTRINSSIGKSYNASSNVITSDFDTIYPWSHMHEVKDSAGNVFIEIPKFYSKVTRNSNGTYKYQISQFKHEGFSTLFTDGLGREFDYIRVGKYEASGSASRCYSKSGQTCLVNTNINQFRNACKANGAGYHLYDFKIDAIIKELFMIEFATTNTQSIMRGYVDGNSAALQTGHCDGILTGSNPSNTGGKSACVYRGIENPFGNIWKWCDGINFRNEEIWLCLDPSQYASDKFAAPYKNVGTRCMTNGWAKVVTPFTDFPLLGYTTEVGGNDVTYYSDYYYQNTGNRVLRVGGAWSDGSSAGLWYWVGVNGSSYTASSIGSRLCYTPL